MNTNKSDKEGRHKGEHISTVGQYEEGRSLFKVHNTGKQIIWYTPGTRYQVYYCKISDS